MKEGQWTNTWNVRSIYVPTAKFRVCFRFRTPESRTKLNSEDLKFKMIHRITKLWYFKVAFTCSKCLRIEHVEPCRQWGFWPMQPTLHATERFRLITYHCRQKLIFDTHLPNHIEPYNSIPINIFALSFTIFCSMFFNLRMICTWTPFNLTMVRKNIEIALTLFYIWIAFDLGWNWTNQFNS